MKKHKKVSISDKKVFVSDNTYRFDTADYLMKNNGFTCGFNMPPALSGEQSFGLPPYRRRAPFLVDKYPACPKNWMRSEGKTKSYFVPVVEDSGMWLDFNRNEDQPHHVAILVSIQGVNTITGLPCNDAHLEQYIEECPKHKIKFGPDRYCSKCDYQWPKQNYISTTGTPSGRLWLDGFRAVNGIVRQYILTAEKMRGVASNIIGKDRVYAIGLSFFVSKEKRLPKPESALRGISFGPQVYGGGILYSQPTTSDVNYFSSDINYSLDMGYLDSKCSAGAASNEPISGLCANDGLKIYRCASNDVGKAATPGYRVGSKGSVVTASNLSSNGYAKYAKDERSTAKVISRRGAVPIQTTTKLEVGAGAKINQQIYDDPEKLCFWHDEPEAIICINYATEKDCGKILDAGEIDVEGSAEGFLKEVPVGN